ncbi:Putative uncharacterized protein [Lactobacillus equicursoris 66c]|uniref:RRXRR domain-containing protein n=1 Tax=Lactobacillus equicursoris 66c TaxID=872326 RepID=K0NUL8_9LACO|nr:Putative uncharacterized protein [Lactobacillus equicursoris 66c]
MKHENANRVFLLNRDGKPLMPCRPRKARLLLKSGKAFVVKKYPFTIQLKYGSYGYKQKKPQDPLPSSPLSQQNSRQA